MTETNSRETSSRPLAVVTGASSGIGYELAKQFAEHGYNLLVTGKSEKIINAAESLRKFGTAVDYLRGDLAKFEDCESLYQWIKSKGPVDALALNAGVGLGGDFIRDAKLEDLLDMIALNVNSTVHLAKRIGGDMVLAKHGRILITASTSAVIPVPYLAVYAATKAFVHSLAISLGSELEGSGVTVTSLMPGPTETSWFDRTDIEDTKLGRMNRDDPAKVAKQGYQAMMKGRTHIVAGSLRNKIQTLLAKYFPMDWVTPVSRFFSQPDHLPIWRFKSKSKH